MAVSLLSRALHSTEPRVKCVIFDDTALYFLRARGNSGTLRGIANYSDERSSRE